MSNRDFASDMASIQRRAHGPFMPSFRAVRGWIVTSVMAVALVPLCGCPPWTLDGSRVIVPVHDHPIAGEWSGKAKWTGKQILTAPAAFEQSFEYETEVALNLGADGRPLNLMLPLVAGSSGADGVAANIFDVGQLRRFEQDSTFTQNGQPTSIHAVWEITVGEASFQNDGFRVVYDYTMDITYTGGALSGVTQRATGRIVYDASLSEEQLVLDQSMVQDYQQGLGGTQITGRQELAGQTVLDRR